MNFLKYNTSAFASRLLIVATDVMLAIVALAVAAILRFNFDIREAIDTFLVMLPVVLIVRLVSFKWFRTYAVIVRFAGASDVLKVFYAVTGGSLLLIGLGVLLRPYGVAIPLSILFIDYFLLLAFMAAIRLMMPSIYQMVFGERVDKDHVIIIGAGRLGAITRNLIKQDIKSTFDVVGILDDNLSIQNKSLDGIPVSSPGELDELLNENEITKAIFAINNIKGNRKNEIVDLCLSRGIQVLQVHAEASWANDNFKISQIKEIEIEDLLDRPVIALDKDNVTRQYKGKKVMITGGAGSIGSEIVRQLIKYDPAQIFILDEAESPLVSIGLECKEELSFANVLPIIADVTDMPRLVKIFDEYTPDIIFHAAAYKHVPIMESYPSEAISVNVGGTKNMAMLADVYEVEKFVMVSTDKAVNPTNVMGASKRIAEIFIQSFNSSSRTNFITTRFGNVLGSNGSVVPRFKKQIAQGGPVTVTHKEITRYFMTIPEASQLVLEAGAMGEGGEIFLFDMGEPVKISDLAKKMIQLSGLTPDQDIEVKYTGLRPGEKLYEELLATKENSIETHHPKITKAKVREYDFIKVEKTIHDLVINIDKDSEMDTVRKMKHIVPEYQSQNSRFKELDRGSTDRTEDKKGSQVLPFLDERGDKSELLDDINGAKGA